MDQHKLALWARSIDLLEDATLAAHRVALNQSKGPIMLPILLATSLLATAPSSPAAGQAEPAVARVPVADLNLASAEGRAALDRRIDQAIARLCGRNEATGLAGHAAAHACAVRLRTQVETPRRQAIAGAGGVDLARAR